MNLTNLRNMTELLADLDEILRLVELGAHFFVGHSGGKDSQAMFAILSIIIPADQLHVVHADLGDVEHEGVKSFIQDNIDGHELLVAEPIHADGSKKDFFSMVRARREKLDSDGKFDAPAFPGNGPRFCTSDLKTGPIWKVIRNATDATIVVNCVGLRSQESDRRSKTIAEKGTFNENKKNSNTVRQAFDWFPIAHWTIEEVWAAIAAKGQERHPAYNAGNDRLSCVFCIFGSQGDLERGAKARPDLARKLIKLEREVRSTMFNGASLADKVGHIAGVTVTVEA
jgi:3'-phosphoadenosine 5'-phosphosulfate sulfotransferase (PAPS reductase)/FAD synthetase